MNMSSLSFASTPSPPARFSADSVVAKRMNWPSQPLSLPCRVSGLDDGRKAVEQRIEGQGIAGEKAADELGRDRPFFAIV